MIPVPVQTVASVLVVTPVQTATSVLAVATLRQPDQAEKTQIQQSINQAVQKAGKKWILKHF